eukprot:CAMPEP_0178913428 /NCGR_PEP_ID=MMETSP0786-20121207/10835_1 /TAXON_ID=186022 /ORGANISM="Thalassionema frauenfeldii, Strain CCMP 1798" /LENGTH=33 /DNA_ID= /DNA_START= /DNA_END= /DNA_ORIENTATION=
MSEEEIIESEKSSGQDNEECLSDEESSTGGRMS